jgi:hypothetical protein
VKFFALTLVVAAFFVWVTISAMASDSSPKVVTYQGKGVHWWASHAVRARKDANSNAATIKKLKTEIAHTRKNEAVLVMTNRSLKAEMHHDSTINECIRLATIAYPAFTEGRAWQIIDHESATSGLQFAKNPSSTASGLYQFLTSTFASTPYGKAGMSIWSPCAQSLAAGWMHENGRGGEWAYG